MAWRCWPVGSVGRYRRAMILRSMGVHRQASMTINRQSCQYSVFFLVHLRSSLVWSSRYIWWLNKFLSLSLSIFAFCFCILIRYKVSTRWVHICAVFAVIRSASTSDWSFSFCTGHRRASGHGLPAWRSRVLFLPSWSTLNWWIYRWFSRCGWRRMTDGGIFIFCRHRRLHRRYIGLIYDDQILVGGPGSREGVRSFVDASTDLWAAGRSSVINLRTSFYLTSIHITLPGTSILHLSFASIYHRLVDLIGQLPGFSGRDRFCTFCWSCTGDVHWWWYRFVHDWSFSSYILILIWREVIDQYKSSILFLSIC